MGKTWGSFHHIYFTYFQDQVQTRKNKRLNERRILFHKKQWIIEVSALWPVLEQQPSFVTAFILTKNADLPQISKQNLEKNDDWLQKNQMPTKDLLCRISKTKMQYNDSSYKKCN